ncbi:MAG: lipoyl(octanoyl) transferase LipB [Candidatus Omnitrophota bacterium]
MDICDLGTVAYQDALSFQTGMLDKKIGNKIPDSLILVEHEPVVTLGRIEERDSITDRGFFDENNIPIVSSGRGGKVTYHGPGQLVLYPIIDLRGRTRSVTFYIDFLERTVAKSLNRLGVPAGSLPGRRGVWVRGKKIAFIGISVKRWVTFHGVAVNINNDIGPFSRIYPCGEKDIEVTSVKEYTGKVTEMSKAKEIFSGQFEKDLGEEYD